MEVFSATCIQLHFALKCWPMLEGCSWSSCVDEDLKKKISRAHLWVSSVHFTASAKATCTLMILWCVQAGQQRPLIDSFAHVQPNMRAACVGVSHEWVNNEKRKFVLRFWKWPQDATLLRFNQLPRLLAYFTGVSFINLAAEWKYSSCSPPHLPPCFSLARFPSLALVSLPASRLTALSFLLWRDPSATLMKRQVLCDSASPVGVTRWRDDGSGAGQWTNAREYGKGDNASPPHLCEGW